MKIYESPVFEFLEIEVTDIVLASGLIEDVFGSGGSNDNSIW